MPSCDVASMLVWPVAEGGYRITHVVRGDVWDEARGGALCKPGVNAAVGDIITHLNRVRLTAAKAPSECLVGKGGAEVMLTFTVGDGPRGPAAAEMAGAGGELAARVGAMSLGAAAAAAAAAGGKGKGKGDNKPGGGGGGGRAGGKTGGKAGGGHKGAHRSSVPLAPPKPASTVKPRKAGDTVNVRIRAMHSELDARYRDLVRGRTDVVARSGGGRVGYLHIPDMERTGYSEFWRHYAAEVRKVGRSPCN